MNAITIREDRKLVPAQVPDPVRKADEIIIQVAAAALNRADLMQVDGNYPPPPGWPEWPGLEVAGTVLATGPDSRFRTGDKVCALLGGGGYAEKVAVPERMVLPVPAGLSMAEASAIPEVFATAYLNFFIEANIQPGETVFLQAGASGLGIAAIQLLKNTVDCRIITTVGSEAKAQFVRELGADIVVNYRTENPAQVLSEHPFDIALDCVGGSFLGENIGKMNPWGRWILIAALGGNRAELPLDTIFRNRLRLIGSTLRSRTDAMKGEVLTQLERRLWPVFASGKIRPVIYRTFDWRDAESAHQILRKCENIGKVVLCVSQSEIL